MVRYFFKCVINVYVKQQEYKEWLKGQITSIEDSETKEELEALHDYWTKSDINKDEQFLRDYILNKK